jgi:hypothetical protein
MADIASHLADIEAIKQLKARYFRFYDTKQWERWRSLFTDDCRFDGTSRVYTSPDEFVAGTRERLGDAMTIHQGHMPEIAITGADSARGIWAMFDLVEFNDVVDHGHGVSRGFTGFGHYEEEYHRENGVWKISFLRLTRLYVKLIDTPPLRDFDDDSVSSRGRDWLGSSSS